MRHVIGTSSAVAAGTLCILAVMGLAAPVDTLSVSPRGAASATAAPPLPVGTPCAGAAWPYPPGACGGVDAAGEPSSRRVRLIAVKSERDPR